jgi:hypothetical protein
MRLKEFPTSVDNPSMFRTDASTGGRQMNLKLKDVDWQQLAGQIFVAIGGALTDKKTSSTK